MRYAPCGCWSLYDVILTDKFIHVYVCSRWKNFQNNNLERTYVYELQREYLIDSENYNKYLRIYFSILTESAAIVMAEC